MNYQNFITIEPGKRGGRPCVRGMRVAVFDVQYDESQSRGTE